MTVPGPLPVAAGSAHAAAPSRGAARSDSGPETRAEPRSGATRGADGSGRSADAGRAGARGEPGSEPPPERPFADLLVPATAPPVAAPAAIAAEPASDSESGASPGQLLALLDGPWSGPRTPVTQAAAPVAVPLPAGMRPGATIAGTAAAQGPATAALATAAPADGASLPAATAAVSTGPAFPGTGAGAGSGFALPAVAPAMAADGGAEAPIGAEPGSTIEAPAPALLSATAPSAATRPQAALAMAPIAMPAEPADGFDDGFGARIAWMADQRIGHAEIRLNPEHVGRIDVRVQLDGSQVRAEFHSAHAEVRQAIEASLPRLRELLGQHGLQLGQADVGQRQAGQDGSAPRSGAAPHAGGDTASGEDTPLSAPAHTRLRGLLDAYA